LVGVTGWRSEISNSLYSGDKHKSQCSLAKQFDGGFNNEAFPVTAALGSEAQELNARQAEVKPQKPSGEAYRANLIEQTDLLSGC
jgi:hypothetical protein